VEVADGAEHHLDPRSIIVGRIIIGVLAGLAAITASFYFLIAVLINPDDLWIQLLIAAGIYLLALIIWRGGLRLVDLEHKHTSYRITEQGIEIREGLVWRSARLVARSRIQHTDVSQGPLQRRFGLGTLTVYTAGTEHSEVSLSGLSHERALEIRDYLGASSGGDVV
jgi:membrane protein YdbS with pleckstrin-like domain